MDSGRGQAYCPQLSSGVLLAHALVLVLKPIESAFVAIYFIVTNHAEYRLVQAAALEGIQIGDVHTITGRWHRHVLGDSAVANPNHLTLCIKQAQRNTAFGFMLGQDNAGNVLDELELELATALRLLARLVLALDVLGHHPLCDPRQPSGQREPASPRGNRRFW